MLRAIPADDLPNAKEEPFELEFSVPVTPSPSEKLNGTFLDAVFSVCTSLSPNSTCNSIAPKLKGKLFDFPSDVPRPLFAAINAVPALTFLTINLSSGEGFPCKPIGDELIGFAPL